MTSTQLHNGRGPQHMRPFGQNHLHGQPREMKREGADAHIGHEASPPHLAPEVLAVAHSACSHQLVQRLLEGRPIRCHSIRQHLFIDQSDQPAPPACEQSHNMNPQSRKMADDISSVGGAVCPTQHVVMSMTQLFELHVSVSLIASCAAALQ